MNLEAGAHPVSPPPPWSEALLIKASAEGAEVSFVYRTLYALLGTILRDSLRQGFLKPLWPPDAKRECVHG